MLSRRQVGNTGIAVSVLGFGGWGIGGPTDGATSYGPVDDQVSLVAIARARALGIDLFDTANVYGDGHSETMIGRGLAATGPGGVVATKAGMVRFGLEPDFSAGAITRSLMGSLERLGRDRVEILQLHNPPTADSALCRALARELDGLRERGLIEAAGWSVKSPAEGLVAMRDYGAQALQMNFNLLDWRAVDCGLFDEAEKRGVGLFVRTPLCFGFLTGKLTVDTQFAPSDHRSAWPRRRIADWLEAADVLFAALEAPVGAESALRFCLSFPMVTSLIVGMMTPEEVDANVAAVQATPFPRDAVARAHAVYRTLPISG